MKYTGQKTFTTYHLQVGLLEDLSQDDFPSYVHSWHTQPLQLEGQKSNYTGFVAKGTATIETLQGAFHLQAGMYFMCQNSLKITGEGAGMVIEQLNYQSFFHLGGPVETQGRLRYIDGCTDSLLIAPPVWGDPCFNLLHIPPHTFQSQHTHPSYRVGMIVRGRGECVLPSGNMSLQPGLMFYIPAEEPHSFQTKDKELLVVAYHPDSDFGPTHENHPMINRTIL